MQKSQVADKNPVVEVKHTNPVVVKKQLAVQNHIHQVVLRNQDVDQKHTNLAVVKKQLAVQKHINQVVPRNQGVDRKHTNLLAAKNPVVEVNQLLVRNPIAVKRSRPLAGLIVPNLAVLPNNQPAEQTAPNPAALVKKAFESHAYSYAIHKKSNHNTRISSGCFVFPICLYLHSGPYLFYRCLG